MDVNQFLSNLTNLEKTRNFNVFKEYTLDGFKKVLDKFGLLESPQNTIRISLVGTNGKGSTAFFLSQLFLISEKLSPVGLYTSPHLVKQNERIQINGKMIPDDWMNSKLASFSNEELNELKTLSYFEFFTLFSILYFQENNCKVEIYEAGLGGRLDATKLVNPDIVILTKIALDHTEILGDNEEKILLEKLEIVGNNTKILFTFTQSNNIMDLTKSFCKKKGIKLVIFKDSNLNDYISFNKEFALFVVNSIFKRKSIRPLPISTLDKLIPMKGRMQVIRDYPLIVFDIGHNPSAIQYLLKSLEKKYPNESKWEIYLGLLKDKDSEEIIRIMLTFGFVDKIYTIVGESWSNKYPEVNKILSISEHSFTKMIQKSQNSSLVLGSFRLFSLISSDELK